MGPRIALRLNRVDHALQQIGELVVAQQEAPPRISPRPVARQIHYQPINWPQRQSIVACATRHTIIHAQLRGERRATECEVRGSEYIQYALRIAVRRPLIPPAYRSQ